MKRSQQPAVLRIFVPLVLLGLTSDLFVQEQRIAADEKKKQGEVFFEQRIRPVLVEHCQDCHGADEAESELRVDSLAGLLRGGMRGPAIVPGDPKKSLLILAVNHADQQLHMPPKKKLPTRALVDLAQWIKMGAPWPNAKVTPAKKKTPVGEYVITPQQRGFWAFQPARKSPQPVVRNTSWVRNPIDRFVLSKLEQANLSPAPRADRRTLIRRAMLDLTGLPPAPQEVEAFLADSSPLAYPRLIDRLLNSPRYGERWGRHWLDVARYADSNGLDENLAYANAFRYRDYVIRAFNSDKPFDRFVVEQLAGDLLPDSDPVAVSDRITATGFLSLGAKMLAEDDPVKMQMDIIDEQIDTTARAFMGLTFGCARCHDHKFDPIPTADYYSLAGIFKSTKTMENFKVVAVWQERPVGSAEDIRQETARATQRKVIQRRLDQLISRANAKVQAEARGLVKSYVQAAADYLQVRERVTALTAHGKAAKIDVPGAIVREAETFERGNLSRLSDGYGKGIGVIAGPGGRNHAELDQTIAKSGLYHVIIRYAAAAARPTRLLVNGQVRLPSVAGNVTGSWYPDTQKWFVEGSLLLEAGKIVLGLERDGPIPHIDKIVLLPARQSWQKNQELKPLFVQQWADYIRVAKKSPNSALAGWHAVAANKPLSSIDKSPARDVLAVLGLRQDPSFGEMVEAYATAFAAAAANKAATAGVAGSGKAGLRELQKILDDPSGPFRVPDAPDALFDKSTQEKIAAERKRKAGLESKRQAQPVAMAVSDARPENVRIHIRGSHVTLGREVPRRFPRILAANEPPIGSSSSGRLRLARWMTSDVHPLTSRVIANRVWHWHFGKGLVRSLDNFGRLGELPTHPLLLDYLAVWLREHDWSLKELHRLIMLSSTYQMSTAWHAVAAERDPENRLISRMNRRRLEAEAIRDSLLAVGQSLDFQMGGTLLPTKNRGYVTSSANLDPAVYRNQRRSVYLPVVRSALYDVFQAFDFADPSVINGKREATTVAPQALFMMNSAFVARQTRALARRLLARQATAEERISAAYLHTMSRSPASSEVQQALAFIKQYQQLLVLRKQSPEESELGAWQAFCRALVSSNEFIFVD